VTRTILVADDSPTMQRRASSLLIAEGLEVVTVSNGVAAINKLPTVRPHLILADVSMPGKDGYEVCEFVKNSAEMSHIPVLLIFSELEPYQADRGKQVRADGCVKKPFNHDDLIATITKFLAQTELLRPAVPLSAPFSAELELGPAVELVEAAPEPMAQPEFNLAALSEGVALTEPSDENAHGTSIQQDQEAISELDPQISESQAENAPIPVQNVSLVDKMTAVGLDKSAETSPMSEPNGDRVPMDSEAATSEAAIIFRTFPEMTVQSEGSEADREVAHVTPDAPSEDRSIHRREFVAEPEPAVVQSETERAAGSEPEPAGLEPETAPPPEVSLEEPAPVAEYPFGAAEPQAASIAEGEELSPISDFSPGVPAPQAALSELEAEKEFSLPGEAVTPEAAKVERLNPELICTIVRKVVLKMSPPALGSEVLEDITRRITSELTAELDSVSS
jgi:CheY-like chemotaxis protein